MYFGTFVQDGLPSIWGIIWGSVPAKFKIEMREMKILGSEVLWFILGHWFRVGYHM